MAVQMPPGRYTIDQLAELAKALEILDKAFPGYDVRLEAAAPKYSTVSLLRPPVPPLPPEKTIREKVIEATRDKHASVLDVLLTTNLDEKRVRGVLNAPDLDFDRIKVGEVVKYRFTGTRQRIRAKSERSNSD